ncbi:CHAP domain-containing protein [Actinokineospora enzanensis]|uniref:C40 family peptidase n=1 Tax=Actinokineospora enzanensis TaxID=155975 RepID=UPI0003A6013E|nr:CHAP domain-containing protein [Actinokineospora enzanensis]
MNTESVVRHFAADMILHRNRLAGKVGDAQEAQQAFAGVREKLVEQHDVHRKAVQGVAWSGRDAAGFGRQAGKVDRGMMATAAAASSAAGIVAEAARVLDGGHGAVVRLLDEYNEKATAVVNAGLAVGQRPALVRAVGQVADLVRTYTAESAKQVAEAKAALSEAAHKLRALTEPVAKHTEAAHKPAAGKAHSTGKAGEITRIAATQLGYHEGANNANKYGPQAAWCSSFASWVWKRSGVDIPITPFTGNVFHWGQRKGLAYHDLTRARPGDVLLFGTGPQNTSTSKHIGIVEKVHGNTVTLIEGNSGPNTDSVVRRPHVLSHNTFYGGVHPS